MYESLTHLELTLHFFVWIQGSVHFQFRGRSDFSFRELTGRSTNVEDNREKWGDFWEKLITINRNIVIDIDR